MAAGWRTVPACTPLIKKEAGKHRRTTATANRAASDSGASFRRSAVVGMSQSNAGAWGHSGGRGAHGLDPGSLTHSAHAALAVRAPMRTKAQTPCLTVEGPPPHHLAAGAWRYKRHGVARQRRHVHRWRWGAQQGLWIAVTAPRIRAWRDPLVSQRRRGKPRRSHRGALP
ncbi:hypothetical protein FB451DRAFT_1371710 [Mycena latifolia]|nr:hypothetical protein FB451DRAFT_1371710 [Mycena latifolia]